MSGVIGCAKKLLIGPNKRAYVFKKGRKTMARNMDEKYLMTPYSLDEDRNRKDPCAGACVEEVKNKPRHRYSKSSMINSNIRLYK